MATSANMGNAVKAYLDKILGLFKKTAGTKGNVLYCDNNDGALSFTQGRVVTVAQVATTTAEVNTVRGLIESNSATHGTMYIDAVALKIQRYNTSTSAWTATDADYYTEVHRYRVYYSPWSKRVWAVDKYGEFKRFLTSTLTLVG